MEIDATDRRILNALQKDGRMTNAELAERVNLSPSACHRRVQRLEEEGIIGDYVALLDARKLGRPTTVFVEITLSGQADEVLEAFERDGGAGAGRAGMPPDGGDGGLPAEDRGRRIPTISPASTASTSPACRGWRRCIRPSRCARCSRTRRLPV